MGRWSWWMAGLLALLVVGCGGKNDQPTQLDILEMLNASQRRHDPHNFEEIDLGEFYITRENNQELPLLVRFQLFAVLHTDDKDDFEKALNETKNTLRDAILAKVKDTEVDYLNDAKLDWLRNQLRPLINRVLETQACRDVVFPVWELEEPISGN